MHAPDAAKLLDVWERGLRLPLQRKVLALLSASQPDTSSEALAALSIGQRDALLLNMREQLFGSNFEALSFCPKCGERVEAAFQASDIRAAPQAAAAQALTLDAGDCRITFRPPATQDLLAIPENTDAAAARRMLIARCVVEARDAQGERVDDRGLPEAAIAALAAHVAQADPQADIELALSCPACRHAWPAVFDIASFLTREIHAWAQCLLRDVHALARGYGWSEAAILALSPTRRQIYLDLVR